MLEFILYILSGFGYALYEDLNLLETALVLAALLFVSQGWTLRIRAAGMWQRLTALASRRKTAVALVFALAVLLRLAILPWQPVPQPVITDEFSHLLLADTLAHGRLTNPTHPEWVHFESIHIIQEPTYNSDYFPGQGAVLALGEVAGHPWIGILLLSGAMCAAICWMLQAWLPPVWALCGGVLAILRFGVASYWIDGYYGGSLAALGGALVLGAVPRLIRRPRISTSVLLGLGFVMIGYSRPFEGLAVAIPAVAALGFSFWKKGFSWKSALPATAITMAGIAGLLVYFQAVTGNPFRTPYQVNEATYGWPMTMPWSHSHKPEFRHVELSRYYDYEKDVHNRGASLIGGLKMLTLKGQGIWRFYLGPALTIPLLMLPRVWRRRRLRLPAIAAAATLFLALIEVQNSPHYSACATAAFLAILLECCRKLRLYTFRGRPAGRQMLAVVPVILVTILVTRIVLESLGLPYTQRVNYQSWCCVPRGDLGKARVLAELDRTPGRHLVLVKPKTDPRDVFQWIYNCAEIDSSRVVWARDMGKEGNSSLLKYFQGRRVWELDPNVTPVRLTPAGP